MEGLGRLINGNSGDHALVDRMRPSLLAFAFLATAGIGLTAYGSDVKKLLRHRWAPYAGPALLVLSAAPGINVVRIYLDPPLSDRKAVEVSPCKHNVKLKSRSAVSGSSSGGCRNPSGWNVCFLNTALQRMARTDIWTPVLSDSPKNEKKAVRKLRWRLREAVDDLREGRSLPREQILGVRLQLAKAGVTDESAKGLRKGLRKRRSMPQLDSTEVMIAIRERLGGRHYEPMETVEFLDLKAVGRKAKGASKFKKAEASGYESGSDALKGVFKGKLRQDYLEFHIHETDKRVKQVKTSDYVGVPDKLPRKLRCVAVKGEEVVRLNSKQPAIFTKKEWEEFRGTKEYRKLREDEDVAFQIAKLSSKTTKFARAPQALEICVRHPVDWDRGKRTKNDRNFVPDLTLDLSDHMQEKPKKRASYMLTDVICRRGDVLGQGGHYWYIRRDPDDPKRWIEYNDRSVSSMSTKQFKKRVQRHGLSFLYLPPSEKGSSSDRGRRTRSPGKATA